MAVKMGAYISARSHLVPFNFASIEIVICANHADLRGEFAKVRTLANSFGHFYGIFVNGVFQGVALLVLRDPDCWLNVANQSIDVARSRIALQCGLNRAAAFVAKYDDEAGAKMIDGIFDAAQTVIIHQVTGGPDNEQVADVLIEYNFGSGA